MNRFAAALLVGILGWMALATLATRDAEAVGIHAHRGGPNADGIAKFPENSMSGFRDALGEDWVIEFDLMRTSDGKAVVMHDSTVDRTTDCSGTVASWTAAGLASDCELDTVGINAATEDLTPGDPRREPIPTLAEVLTLLKETGGRANIEVKDLTNDFPTAVYQQIATSGVNARKVIIQNFAKPGLEPVASLLPGAGIALLTLNGSEYYFSQAKSVNGNWISPSWSDMTEVPRDQYVADAHAQGLKVVPWTVDEEADLLAVEEAGADAVISNDPTLAQVLIGTEITKRAMLDWKVKPAVRKVKRKKKAVYTVRIENHGTIASGRVRVQIGFPRGRLRLRGAASRVLAPIRAKRARTLKFRFTAKPEARPGRAVLRFRIRGLRGDDRIEVRRQARTLRILR